MKGRKVHYSVLNFDANLAITKIVVNSFEVYKLKRGILSCYHA